MPFRVSAPAALKVLVVREVRFVTLQPFERRYPSYVCGVSRSGQSTGKLPLLPYAFVFYAHICQKKPSSPSGSGRRMRGFRDHGVSGTRALATPMSIHGPSHWISTPSRAAQSQNCPEVLYTFRCVPASIGTPSCRRSRMGAVGASAPVSVTPSCRARRGRHSGSCGGRARRRIAPPAHHPAAGSGQLEPKHLPRVVD